MGRLLGAAALVVAALTGAASGRSTATVDRKASCAAASIGGAPAIGLQFTTGYGDTAAWFGVALNGSGTRQAAQVGVEVPPHIEPGVCRRTAARVPLSSRGLPGPASRLDTFVSCTVSRRFLVHMRAVTAGGKVLSATAVVRTARGAPVAFASIGRDGRGRILTSARCA